VRQGLTKQIKLTHTGDVTAEGGQKTSWVHAKKKTQEFGRIQGVNNGDSKTKAKGGEKEEKEGKEI